MKTYLDSYDGGNVESTFSSDNSIEEAKNMITRLRITLIATKRLIANIESQKLNCLIDLEDLTGLADRLNNLKR